KGGLHNDVGPTVETGDRFHWYSNTGWIMWNSQVGALLGGTTICVYDGNPGGRAGAPDWATLWRFAGASGATFFGAGAAFFASCLKAGVEPMPAADRPRLGEVGELVCTQPMPSMPLYFWGDAGNRRLLDSYFDMFPGIWRHGDWIRIVPHRESGSSGAIIYGRSDATINRHGIRMGTA